MKALFFAELRLDCYFIGTNLYAFFRIFNEENGTLIRSDVNEVDSTMRSFPELLDVGIIGHCTNGVYCKNTGIDCYQKGNIAKARHMTVEDFECIAISL